MPDSVSAKLVFDESSQLGVFRYHMWHRYRFWLLLRTVASVSAIIGAGVLIMIEGLTPLPILMIMVGTFAFLRPMIWKILHSRNLRQLPGYGQSVTYTISAEQIKVRGETKHASIPRQNLFESLTLDQGLLLYHNKKAYTWIPREAFDSDEEFQQVTAWYSA